LLLKAAQYVLAVRPDTTFVFVGGGPSRKEWEALAARLGIAGNVVFTGPRGDIPGVYASLDLLVLPSLDEALPMCLLEGMAAGTPVIATRVGAVPDLVIPNVTGTLLEPGQADGLAGAILELLRDPVQARRLGENGRAHVMRNYSVEATAKNYLDVYESALHRREIRMQPRCGQQELSA
jgi:glycosyltransferase involved in cell wall biosynthesis